MSPTLRTSARRAAWIAILGTVVALTMLFLPTSTREPGDAEAYMSCGNAFYLDMDPRPQEEDYFYSALRSCTGNQIERTALAVGVLAATGLAAAGLMARSLRKRVVSGGSGKVAPADNPRFGRDR